MFEILEQAATAAISMLWIQQIFSGLGFGSRKDFFGILVQILRAIF
jgi:hypothetical protein